VRSTVRSTLYKYGPLTLLVLLIVGAWQFSLSVFEVPEYMVPSPAAVLDMGIQRWSDLAQHSWVTLKEILLGFALSVVVGVPLAVVIVFSKVLERMLYPLLVASQAVPKIAIAPLFIVWVGFGTMPKVLMAFLISFFPIVIDTIVGLRSIQPEMIHLARSMGTGSLTSFVKVRLPNALPNIFGGLKIAITLAVVGAVAAEFVGADSGLGYLLVVATGQLNTPLLFAALIVLSLIGIVLFALVALAERLLLPWHVSNREADA
jgi:NitT/TauT family transport system permease protein